VIGDATKLQAVRNFSGANKAVSQTISEGKNRGVIKGVGEVIFYPTEFRHNLERINLSSEEIK
jgi:hypothetical protein